MSSGGAQVAVLGMRGHMLAARQTEPGAERPHAVRASAFAALGLYGAARWSKLLSGGTHGRIIGVLALAVLLAAARPPLARRSRPLAAAFTALVLVSALPVAGVPLAWVLHLRLAVIAAAVGQGLNTLPQVLVPYTGPDRWVRLDIVLGGAVLLFDAALLIAFAPRVMDGMRRAGAALPLVALVAVPSTIAPPRYPYLNGLLLFLLLAAFVLGDRINNRRAAAALGLCLLSSVAAMLIAPGLDRRTPWLNYKALAEQLAPRVIDSFNWTQNYGPIDWPRRGRTVLDVTASRPDYWKAEDLDVFDGRAWTEGVVPGQENTPAPAPSSLAAWSQTLHVRVADMRTSDVIGAGLSSHPTGSPEPALPGFSAGTWTTGNYLGPGDSYSVRVYTPEPTPAQLRGAGHNYAGLSTGYRTILLPAGSVAGATGEAQVVFAPFHSAAPPQNVIGLPVSRGYSVIEGSPYARAYRLARRLARSAATPYAFALAVERYLSHGYAYTSNPPLRPFPLLSFLFADRRGYCQQFAGAMALLLRMGGVPARVAVGFTQGRHELGTRRWVVSDMDAHAWDEVWFPRLGWVRFDPTPPVDPALSGLPPIAGAIAALTGSTAQNNRHLAVTVSPKSRVTPPRQAHGPSASGAWETAAAGAGALLLVMALAWLLTRPVGSVDGLVGELERALARSGRPLAARDTLAGLERRLGTSAGGERYIRALRLARFGESEKLPTLAERRALRAALASGRGPLARLRTLWALPPRRQRPRRGRPRAIRTAVDPGA